MYFLKNRTDSIVSCLVKSGLKVNEIKTEFCMFHKSQQERLRVNQSDFTKVKSALNQHSMF